MPTCEVCDGYKTVECPECEVKVRVRNLLWTGIGASNCSSCNGYGKIDCPKCGGFGSISI